MNDILEGDRLLCIALAQNSSDYNCCSPLQPHNIAGMGLVRACVRHPDGTGHMVVQGLARVALSDISKEKPYRTARVRPIPSCNCHGLEVEALMIKVVELAIKKASQLKCSSHELTNFLQKIRDPDLVCDVIGFTLIRDPQQKQHLLETADVRKRLHDLIPMLK